MIDLRRLALVLGGDVIGANSVSAPGPGHSPKDRSLSVRLTSNGRIVVHSFAGDDWRTCREHVVSAMGGGPPIVKEPPLKIVREKTPNESALRLWREAVDPAGTLIERYLAKRNLVLPELSAHAIRFHPACPFGTERLPCMIGLFRDIASDEPRAIHRTALTADGDKIDRKVLGPKRSCAIKLTPSEDVEYGLTISEGIETAFAGIALGFTPAWGLGDAGSIAKFPVLSGIECLTVLVDHDETGRAAALECSHRWTRAGCEVFRVVPAEAGADMADIVTGRAA